MNLQIALGRAASRVQSVGAGMALGLAAWAALFAAEAYAETPAAPAPIARVPIARAAGDGPALWVIRDADSTVYLFGTVHLLKPGTAWGSDKVDAAFDSATDVWFEVVNPDDHAAIAPIIQQHGLSPDRPLSGWMTADEQAILSRVVSASGMTAQQIDPFRPWFAAMMIATNPLTQAGYDPAQGVEVNLRARALAVGKTLHGFETIDQQITGLAEMSDDGQMIYLRHYLKTYDAVAADMDRLVASWVVGDQTATTHYARENGRAISEETHQIFMARRNADWADQIETLLAGSGTSFIAVGAAHLAGDDSLQDLLTARGIEAIRQ
jgi:uncharacterized protein YbaP (TraB family)